MNPAGFHIHGNFDRRTADLPEERKLSEIARLPQISPADNTAIGQSKKFPQHILPAPVLFLEHNTAALDDDVFWVRLQNVGSHISQLRDGILGTFEHRSSHV